MVVANQSHLFSEWAGGYVRGAFADQTHYDSKLDVYSCAIIRKGLRNLSTWNLSIITSLLISVPRLAWSSNILLCVILQAISSFFFFFFNITEQSAENRSIFLHWNFSIALQISYTQAHSILLVRNSKYSSSSSQIESNSFGLPSQSQPTSPSPNVA